MKIGLVDVDGHNFPNLALMKISSYFKRKGNFVEFANIFNSYDIIFKSKIFSWTADDLYFYKTDKIITGGTGYGKYNTLPEEIEHICPDYTLYNLDTAYGFLTRGCIRHCNWCIVPEKEGKIKPHADIEEFIDNKKQVIIMDNNILASDYGLEQIEKMSKMNIKVDFNQGLDARLIDDSIAKLLSKIKYLSPLRLSCDTIEMIDPVIKAIEILRKNNVKPQQYFIYMIVDDINSALERARILKKMNTSPFAQPYIDFRKNIKEPSQEQKKICRWINHKAIFQSIDYEEYR